MSLDRERLLDEMGLAPRWLLRERPPVARAASPAGTAKAVQAAAETPAVPVAADVKPAQAPTTTPAPAAERRERVADTAHMDWKTLRQRVAECRACALCRERRQAVAGIGDESADWLFVGEGPGAEEDVRGEPFVGAAGKLLDAMLAAIGLERGSDVYIANAVKCRPPNNRTPEADEIAACAPYLARQIALLEPRLIVLLGRAAVQAVLGEERSLASLRGKSLSYRGGGREIPVIVTYHPAYLLRNLPDKAKAWEDLCRARALMRSLKAG